MKVGFVFTNYNNANYTKDAIESINKINNNDSKVVIVDNKSIEKDILLLKEIERNCSNVEVIYNNKNIGYFSGLNMGVKYIRDNYNEYNYLVIGNNDVLFPLDFISSINNKIELFDRYPVVSPSIVTLDGFHQNPHVISNISKIRFFISKLYYLFSILVNF